MSKAILGFNWRLVQTMHGAAGCFCDYVDSEARVWMSTSGNRRQYGSMDHKRLTFATEGELLDFVRAQPNAPTAQLQWKLDRVREAIMNRGLDPEDFGL